MQVYVLGLLLLQPERSWTLDELASVTGATSSSIHREVLRALDAGLIHRDAARRPHRFQAATDSPAFEPLQRLLEVTVGVAERFRLALAQVGGIDAAAIHGSWAHGRVRSDSDIDVLVISDGDRIEIKRALRAAANAVGREVDVSVVSSADAEQMRTLHNPFFERIERGPRIDLVGSMGDVAAHLA